MVSVMKLVSLNQKWWKWFSWLSIDIWSLNDITKSSCSRRHHMTWWLNRVKIERKGALGTRRWRVIDNLEIDGPCQEESKCIESMQDTLCDGPNHCWIMFKCLLVETSSLDQMVWKILIHDSRWLCSWQEMCWIASSDEDIEATMIFEQ